MFPARDNKSLDQNGNIAIFIIIFVITGAIAFLVWIYLQNSSLGSSIIPQTANVCTMEAKICPDGSSVGRSGPQCEFAKCKEISYSNYNDPNGYSITYPSNWTFLNQPYEGLLSSQIFGPPSESTNSAEINQALGYIQYGPAENIVSTGGAGYIGANIYSDRFFNFRPGDWLTGYSTQGKVASNYEKPENISIDNRNSMKQISTSQTNPNLKTINYYIPQDDQSGNIFFLSYTYNIDNPTAADYQKILDQMISSLKFQK